MLFALPVAYAMSDAARDSCNCRRSRMGFFAGLKKGFTWRETGGEDGCVCVNISDGVPSWYEVLISEKVLLILKDFDISSGVVWC